MTKSNSHPTMKCPPENVLSIYELSYSSRKNCINLFCKSQYTGISPFPMHYLTHLIAFTVLFLKIYLPYYLFLNLFFCKLFLPGLVFALKTFVPLFLSCFFCSLLLWALYKVVIYLPFTMSSFIFF